MRNILSLVFIFSIAMFSWQCGDSNSTDSTAAATDSSATSTPAASKSTSYEAANGTVIKGQIKNADNLTLFVEQFSFLDRVHDIQGKQTIDGSGKFEIVTNQPIEAGVYRLRLGRQKLYIPFDGGEKEITINGDLNNFNVANLDVQGAKNFKHNAKIMDDLNNNKINKNNAEALIDKTENPALSMLVAMNVFGQNPKYLDLHRRLNQELAAVSPKSVLLNKHKSFVRNMEATANDPIQIGKEAPNIALEDPNGKTRSLSDLKGKVVLLDFWASWCGPCRRENPNVVRVYDKYNKEGFEVFSVSLDKPNAKQRWVAAIEKDNLKWPWHVSDLQGWGSAPAKMYKVSGIPRTFLLDRDGKIAEINPRGPALEPAVKKLLAQS